MPLGLFKPKVLKKARRVVWRMSASNPAGEFVCTSDREDKPVSPAEVHERGFRASSMELTDGAEVIETEMNTLPGEWIEAFFKDGR